MLVFREKVQLNTEGVCRSVKYTNKTFKNRPVLHDKHERGSSLNKPACLLHILVISTPCVIFFFKLKFKKANAFVVL